ncbi:hypothetical protein U1Q18_013081 [Sarracenia purpurea var. burkii]
MSTTKVEDDTVGLGQSRRRQRQQPTTNSVAIWVDSKLAIGRCKLAISSSKSKTTLLDDATLRFGLITEAAEEDS